MASIEPLVEALEVTTAGKADKSGKTPLDSALEQFDANSAENRAALAKRLCDLFPVWTAQSSKHLEFARELVRRTRLADRAVAKVLRILLGQKPTSFDVERRLWLSLTLMDLGFPRTVASLTEDTELRETHVGEWLTLVAANDDYEAVEQAFVDAVKDGLVSVPQATLKAEVIRQRFGQKLRTFLVAIIDAYSSSSERFSLANAAKQMYGLNLPTSDPKDTQWWSEKTTGLIDRVYTPNQIAA
jgi:hypothetical protein